eukprot:g7642.t1
MPLPGFAEAAVYAGYRARHEKLTVTKQPPELRHATVFDTKNDHSMVAEDWMRAVKQGRYEDEANGAGTPLVCLYLLGWIFGKHKSGLMLALLPIALCWVSFARLSLENGGASFGEMWIALMVMFSLSACFFDVRISKRTPDKLQRSLDYWAALLIETFLANTLTCVAHGSGFFARAHLGEGVALFLLGVTTFPSPFVFWYALQNKVLDRQHAYIKRRNLAKGDGWNVHGQPGRRGVAAHRRVPNEAQRCAARKTVRGIVETSRDLRMTGLSIEELRRLAYHIDRDEAGFIHFYTERVESRKEFDLLRKFDDGYKNGLEDDGGGALRGWITEWLRDVSSFNRPWMSVRNLARGPEPPNGCPLDRGRLSDPKERIWGLCGAIAKVCDEQTGQRRNGDERREWYALMASALSVNRNAMAAILAMEKDSRKAEGMKRNMEIGCEQVLGRVDSDRYFSEGRGLVFTDAKVITPADGDVHPPVITYSAAGVSHAEISREAVMLGEDAFNSLWRARGVRDLTLDEKVELRSNSVEWSKKMVIHVDFKDTFAFLGLKDTALAHVQAAAKRGYLMHLFWVLCVIFVQRFFPRLLPCLAGISIAFLQLGVADQCAHLLYVVVHLRWFAPLSMSDVDVDHAAWCGFVLAVGIVNVGSAYAGLVYSNPFEKAAFWGLVLGSVAPGLWFFFMGGKNVERGHNGSVVRYVGRKKGTLVLDWTGTSFAVVLFVRLQ